MLEAHLMTKSLSKEIQDKINKIAQLQNFKDFKQMLKTICI